jgi:hypothetical protein
MEFLDLALPTDVLERAAVRGNEPAWPIDDIPEFMGAVRDRLRMG